MNITETIGDLGLAVAHDHPAVTALVRGEYARAVEATRAELSSEHAVDFAVLHVLSRALAKQTEPFDARTRALFRQFLKREDVRKSLFRRLLLAPLIREVSPGTLEVLLVDLARDDDDLVPTITGLVGFLTAPARGRVLTELARNHRDEIRLHLFALLGKHQRLTPPGSINYAEGAEPEYTSVLAIGLQDANARVRERAVAAAYGLGLIPRLREHVLALVQDPDMAVRQYSIVALGVLDDEVSKAILQRLLREGSKEECTSAIWAAARRRDLIADVLAMAGDEREWVNNELLGAFAEVSVPLTDEQIAELTRRTSSPELAELCARHIARTRQGLPERGPDNRIDIVLKD